MRPPRSAVVQIDGSRCGILEETEGGTRFVYDADWLARPEAGPVSLTLPLRAEPFEAPGPLHPFFANLLPEGWLLEIAMSKLKLSRDDAFGLLLALGADCVGAVEVRPAESRRQQS